MRHRTTAWWRSCGKLDDAGIDDKTFLRSCVRARAGQNDSKHSACGTWTADFMLRQNESNAFLRKNSNDPHVLWRHRRRQTIDGNSRDHSGSQMACKNQTAIRCRLQIMQKGTRATRCEHWKFAGGDVWAHQQCFLRWNGNNCHGCLPLHLETFVCQHTSCTNTKRSCDFFVSRGTNSN